MNIVLKFDDMSAIDPMWEDTSGCLIDAHALFEDIPEGTKQIAFTMTRTPWRLEPEYQLLAVANCEYQAAIYVVDSAGVNQKQIWSCPEFDEGYARRNLDFCLRELQDDDSALRGRLHDAIMSAA